jgi:CrcB protein
MIEDEPTDSDVDLRIPAQRRELVRRHLPVLGVIALGGGLGALARHGLATALPAPAGHFPWATFLTNVSGCLLIGVLMVLVTEVWSAHPLVRPFLGVGVLGGFTTFSTYAVEIHGLLRPGTVGLAFAYLAGTLLGAAIAVLAGVRITRLAVRGKEVVSP